MKITYKKFKETQKPLIFKVDFQPANGTYPLPCIQIGIKNMLPNVPDEYNYLSGYAYSIDEVYDLLIDSGVRAIAVLARVLKKDKFWILKKIHDRINKSFEKGWNKDVERIKNVLGDKAFEMGVFKFMKKGRK